MDNGRKEQSFLLKCKEDYEKRGYVFDIPECYEESKNKKMLIMTHQLSRTGAPMALFTMAKVLKEHCDILILSVEDGELRRDYIQMGIPVVISGRYWERSVIFKSVAKRFDGVVANTVLNFPAVMLLNGLEIPVFWWIHEHENYFEYGRGEIPNPHDFKDNVHVFAVGEYVQSVIREEFNYTADILRYGIPAPAQSEHIVKKDKERLCFYVVGSYGWEKGQDLMVRAYSMLPQSYKEVIKIIFVGNEKERDEDIYQMVAKLCKMEANAVMEPLMPRDKIFRKYQEADGIILTSRREVLSMAVLENMMLKKCVLVSDGSGNCSYIEDGVNGYCFENENVKDLVEKIKLIYDNRKELPVIGENAKKVYDTYFSMETFAKSVEKRVLAYII